MLEDAKLSGRKQRVLGRVSEYGRKYGLCMLIRRVAESATGSIARWITATPILREGFHPSLSDLIGSSESYVLCSAREIANIIFSPPEVDKQLTHIVKEHRILCDELSRRYSRSRFKYPRLAALEEESGLLIYAIMRLMEPTVILETGVANGESTFFILNAIQQNGRGQLYSTDISDDVGALLEDKEKTNWSLEVLNVSSLSRRKESFRNAIDRIPAIDFFIHDSDHSYWWSRFEYESVYPKMTSDSIMASDDVDFSYAFIDFARKVGAKPLFLLDKRKAFGVLSVGSFQRGSGKARSADVA